MLERITQFVSFSGLGSEREIDGNIIDIKFISFNARGADKKPEDIHTDSIVEIPLNVLATRRSYVNLYPREKKPIDYPVKDLFPKDRDEESGSGSGDCEFHLCISLFLLSIHLLGE